LWPASSAFRASTCCPLSPGRAFLGSGIGKLADFSGASAEAASLGLQPATLVAAAVIVVQLGGSALFLTRRLSWLGAGLLAVFTIVATLIAHPFWRFEGLDRIRQTSTFLEHLAIVGGFWRRRFWSTAAGSHERGRERSAGAFRSRPDAFAPLRHKLFAIIWLATVLGNIGSFMRDVASAWLVTDLSASPLAVSAIQAAGTLPSCYSRYRLACSPTSSTDVTC
jgi:uncharacterized membrane protein YphA (DoxX/SURF4 family)